MEVLLKLAIVVVVGMIGGKIATKFKLPSVSGYLVAGLFLGPSFFDLVTKTDSVNFEIISELALSFIAFSIGSEFVYSEIKKMGKNVVVITLLEVIGAIGVVFSVMYFVFNQDFALSIVIASMSAATAPAATLMVMKQYRAHGPVTKTLLPVVALDDVFGIIAFGIALAVAKMSLNTSGSSGVMMFFEPVIEIVGSIGLGVLIGVVLAVVAKKQQTKDDLQIVSITAIALATGLSNWLGLSSLLTNIVVGTVLVNLLKHSGRVFGSVNDFVPIFYVLFFTLAGASLDLSILVSVGSMGIAYIFARGIGKYLGAFMGASIVKAPDTVRKYLGFALLPQGGISIGLSVIVRQQLPQYATMITTIIMFSVLVYETSGPIFAKIAISKAKEINGLDRMVDESLSEPIIKQEFVME
ncbi:predicted cation/H+ exchanger [Paracholeplasma brassicae]|jgi:Kef-type K+ transport system membrane component KefB|uniref:Predicted cation/H+ exchanger n=1 Tax=Acholeplasma brassicae TaxID=61635 RepID=U4KMK2_9MOLU|nr:cation:proton antiporter [Paracholeplasma brassicae]CCV65355.1 predicted cation/H+ exchanger [Paracholeplasma brassicae]